jgi:hypothetical protein
MSTNCPDIRNWRRGELKGIEIDPLLRKYLRQESEDCDSSDYSSNREVFGALPMSLLLIHPYFTLTRCLLDFNDISSHI